MKHTSTLQIFIAGLVCSAMMVLILFNTSPVYSTGYPTAIPTPLPTSAKNETKLIDTEPIRQVQTDREGIGPLSFSPSLKLLAVGFNGGIEIYDTRTYTLRNTIHLAYQVEHLAFSPNGSYLAATSHYTGNHTNIAYVAQVWDPTKWKILATVKDGAGGLTSLAWDRASRIFITGHDTTNKDSSALFLWYARGAAVSRPESRPISAVAVDKENTRLFAGSPDGYIYVYDLLSGKIQTRVRARPKGVLALAGNPANDLLAAGYQDGHITLWNISNPQPVVWQDLQANSMDSLAFSNNGKLLAYCTLKGQLAVAAIDHLDQPQLIHYFETNCVDAAFSPDDATLAATFFDGTIRVYSIRSNGDKIVAPTPLPKSQVQTTPTQRASFPQSTSLLLPAPDPAAIRPSNAAGIQILSAKLPLPDLLKDYSSNLPTPLRINGTYGFTLLAIDSTNRFQAVIEKDSVRVLDPNGGLILTLQGNGSDIHSLSFAPESGLLAGGTADGSVFLWDSRTGNLKCEIFRTPVEAKSVQFNHSNTLLAVGYDDQTIELYAVEDCRFVAQLPRTSRHINDLAFSPDDNLLSSAAADTSAQLFQLPILRLLNVFEPDHTIKGLFAVAFNPDQTILAVGSYEGIVTLWNVHNKQFLTRLHVGTLDNPTTSITFSKDGTRMFVCMKDETCSVLGIH